MLQFGLADDHFKAIHVLLAMIQSALHTRAYTASSKLISCIKRMFVENLNTSKVMRVGMVNSFQLNGMENQGFPSAKSPAPFRGTGPAV